MLSTIEEQSREISALLNRGILKRIVETGADVQRVALILRGIESLVNQVLVRFLYCSHILQHSLPSQLDVTMRTNVVVENVHSVCYSLISTRECVDD